MDKDLFQKQLQNMKSATSSEKEEGESHLIRDLAVGAGSWIGTDLALKGVGAALTAFPPTAPAGAFLMSPGGTMVSKILRNALTGAASLPVFEFITGKLDNKPNEEILANMPARLLEDQLFLAGLGVTFPLIGKAGKMLKGVQLPGGGTWETSVGEPLWKMLSKAANFRFLDHIAPRSVVQGTAFKGRASIAEIFQPAVERLQSGKAAMFRKAAVSESLAGHTGRVIGERLKDMTAEERFHVFRFLKKGIVEEPKSTSQAFKGMPIESQEKVTEVLGDLSRWMSSTRDKSKMTELIRRTTFSNEVRKLFQKGITDRQSRYDATYFQDLKKVLDQTDTSPKTLQRGLLEVMKNPGVKDEAKSLAKDLYLLGETTFENLPRAAAKAEYESLYAKMRVSPGFISREAKQGYIQSKHSEFKNLFLPRDVEFALQDLQYSPKLAHGIYNKFFLSPWKLSKVVLRVPTQIRNVLSNMIQNDWGGLSVARGDIYWKALQGLRKGDKLTQNFLKSVGTDVTFSGVEFTHFPRVLPPGGSSIELASTYLTNLAGAATRPFAKTYQMAELWAKYAKYLHNVERGMGHSEAVRDAVKWTFNYGEVTPAIRWARVSVAPFATWTSKVLPLMAETAVKHPLRLAKWAALPPLMTQLALSNMDQPIEEEWEQMKVRMPEYLKGGMISLIPFRDDKGRLMVYNWTWMLPGIGDLFEMGENWPQRVFLQNPFISLAADLGRNRTFSGAPVYYEWEDPKTKIWRFMTHAWRQMTPSMVGDDIVALNKSMTNQEGALTPLQHLSSQLGVKPLPLEEPKISRDYGARLRAKRGEIQANLRRELRGVTDEEKRAEIVQKYIRYMKKEMKIGEE